MQALSDDDDEDEDAVFDASNYPTYFGKEVGSDEDEDADLAKSNEPAAASQEVIDAAPDRTLPPLPIEEDTRPVRTDAEDTETDKQVDPDFGPAAANSSNSIVGAAAQKRAEVAVIAASQAASNNAASSDAPTGVPASRTACSDDEDDENTTAVQPPASKARGKRGRAPKVVQGRRQQESGAPRDVAVVDTNFLSTLNVAVKNKRLRESGLQMCDFKKFIQGDESFKPTRLEFELPANMTKENAPWAVENANGRLCIPPVPMDFATFYTSGIRKEADEIVENAKKNDINLFRHCAAATITCDKAEENMTFSTIAFMRVDIVEPPSDAENDIKEAWNSFRQRICRESDGMCTYEILVVLGSKTFGILKGDKEVTGMFFAESALSIAPNGGRPSTARHYNSKFDTLFQGCEFEDEFCIQVGNKKRTTGNKRKGAPGAATQTKTTSTQPTIVAAISREPAAENENTGGVSDDEESDDDEEEETDSGGAASSSTAVVIAGDTQPVVLSNGNTTAEEYGTLVVNATAHYLGPASKVSTYVMNGNVYMVKHARE
jgi:hypothetical protein